MVWHAFVVSYCDCLQIQGTGNGAGQNPVSTAPYIAVINNVCPQCAPGDIDLQVKPFPLLKICRLAPLM